jgi:D-sedoheptulose 7-phosphate isomerase
MQNHDTIKQILLQGVEIRKSVANDSSIIQSIHSASESLIECIKQGGTIYACGNGGSSNDAMHLTEELVARYKRERPGIRAMHFMDAAVLTCWSNDYNFESVFERQVNTFCTKKDVLIAISTSGNSKNILKAAEAAKKIGTKVIGLSGKDGGELKETSDISIIIPAQETERIQEMHITVIHIFCELIELNK